MKIQNISNYKSQIYLFTRNKNGKLFVEKDNTFLPYFYEIGSGKYKSYDNLSLIRRTMNEPREVKQERSLNSYEADILYPKRYIIDRIDKFDKCPIKYLFLDIEVMSDEIPDANKAEYTVSCITIYNSLDDSIQTWWLKDYELGNMNIEHSENEMLNSFVEYIKEEQPDLILAWNVSFDYNYLFNRIEDFAKRISPINQARYGEGNILYPAGISIVDYLGWDKKITLNKRQSYALNYVIEEEFNIKRDKIHFGDLSDEVKKKNIEDVEYMVKLEKKHKYIDYFDEIRRFAMCLWEDLQYNSRVLDIVVLKEAKKRNIILPNKQQKTISQELEGAYRRADIGIFKDVYKADAKSMYPSQIINFCLDPQNIKPLKSKTTIKINNINIEQNPNTLLISISKRLLNQKNIIKTELKKLNKDNEEYKNLKNKYEAIKSLVNSIYGIMAYPSFRLYNLTIASLVTFLSRDLLKYAEKKMKELGYEVIYVDTDSIFYKADKDETDLLNRLVIDWAIEKYGKDDINIEFESEGKFNSLIILGKCHYHGFLEEVKKPEIKGMEIKRSNSSKYEAWFQEELINKIHKEENKKQIINWIKSEQHRIKTLPIEEIAFPAKIANKQYKNIPIWIRAYENTKKLRPGYKINKGEIFYYIFTRVFGEVLAFKKGEDIIHRNVINWEEVIRRNIHLKAENIFISLGWNYNINGQLTLI